MGKFGTPIKLESLRPEQRAQVERSLSHMYGQPSASVPARPPEDDVPVSRSEAQAERKMHTEICQELNRREIEYVHAAMNKRSTLPVGWPDFTIFCPGRRAWFAEIKTPTGKVSSDQKKRIAKLEADGYEVFVPRTLETFISLLLERLPRTDQ